MKLSFLICCVFISSCNIEDDPPLQPDLMTNNKTTKASSNNASTQNNKTTHHSNNNSTTNNSHSCEPKLGRVDCDLLCQSGCKKGESCVPGSAGNSNKCIPSGGGKQGGKCDDSTDCSKGLFCFGFHGVRPTCSAICPSSSNNTCSENATCVPPQLLLGSELPAHGLCREKCSIFPDNCPTDERCVLAGANDGTMCVPIGIALEGNTCTPWECQKGYECIVQAGKGICRKLCSKKVQCVNGVDCTIFYKNSTEKSQYGICIQK